MRTPCKHPGCNALMVAPGYCERHAASTPKRGESYQRWRRQDAKQSEVDRFRSSRPWQRLSKLKLTSDPLCEDPFGNHARRNHTESARQVHHVKGLSTHPELGLSWTNLMSVCWQCHARLEAEVRSECGGSE